MGKIVIYRNGVSHLDLVERGKRTISSATLTKSLLSDDSVKLKVASNSILDIKINDTFEVFGENYRINTLPSVQKVNNSRYEYDIEGQGLMYDLLRCKFFNADGTGFKTETNFPLIGDLELFLTVVKNNMQRFSALWEIGNFPAGTETKTLTFGDDSCLSAIQKICTEFKTDFWVKSEAGKFKIHTGSFGSVIPIPVEYGKGKGLYSLSRSSVEDDKLVNRLYVTGGSDNLPNEYRNFSNSLKFSDDGYIEDTAMIAEIGLKEGSLNLPEIYPHRTGKVTALGSGFFKFIDNTMDFDLNERDENNATVYLIPGTSAKIHFNTGNLAGYEFEIKKNGYNHTTKEFEIIPFTNDSGQTFPDKDSAAFQFAVNDEYVLLDIYAPASYVTAAETELLTEATTQFALLKQAKVSYDLNIDPSYLSQLAKLPEIGDMLNVKDTALGIDKVLRINTITRNFIQGGKWVEYDHKITIADGYEINYSSQLILEVQDIRNIINIKNLGQINYSLIGLKTTEELRNLVFDTDGYFDAGNIKPFSISTNMLTVGAQSQQLSCSVVFRVNYNGNNNLIQTEAGKLFSQTLNKTWDIPALQTLIPDSNFRYVYAKCSKTGTAGAIHYTQTQIKFDEDPNDFYFLLGILHSVTEGLRVLSITIGTTTINGGLVRTGIISSLDGLTYFNLNTGEIRGNITFTNDSPAFGQIADSIIIGGRNLLRNSDFKTDVSLWIGNGSGETFNWDAGTLYLDNGGTGGAVYQSVSTPAGKYAVSFKVKPNFQSGTPPYKVRIWVGASYVDVNIHTSATWQRYTATLETSAAGSVFVIQPLNGVQRLYFDEVKLEAGTKATDWTPAIEDVAAQIDGANANSANALAQAQNAINTANSAAAVTNFLQTTVDGNVVSTGTLQVGDLLGANAGITGVTDTAGSSIRFWAGGSYAEKNTANWSIADDGVERTFHPNGQLATIRGNIDGIYYYNFYHEDGYLLFKLDPNRGLVNVAYTDESWSVRYFAKLTVTNEAATDFDLEADITPLVTKTGTIYSIQANKLTYECYEYFNGTLPANASYQIHNGYKINFTSRTANIPDGWYILRSGALFINAATSYPMAEVTFIENGIEKIYRQIPITTI